MIKFFFGLCRCVTVCLSVRLWVYTNESVGAQRGVRMPLQQQLQTVVTCLAWALGSKPRSRTRAASALINRAISPALLSP